MDQWLAVLSSYLDAPGPVKPCEPKQAYYTRFGRRTPRLAGIAPLAALIGLVVVATLGALPL